MLYVSLALHIERRFYGTVRGGCTRHWFTRASESTAACFSFTTIIVPEMVHAWLGRDDSPRHGTDGDQLRRMELAGRSGNFFGKIFG
jgi:hypothetical protein